MEIKEWIDKSSLISNNWLLTKSVLFVLWDFQNVSFKMKEDIELLDNSAVF